MREIRSSGSVEGVLGNHDSYSDFDFTVELFSEFLFRTAHSLRETRVHSKALGPDEAVWRGAFALDIRKNRSPANKKDPWSRLAMHARCLFEG
jgi:hypothetical protein